MCKLRIDMSGQIIEIDYDHFRKFKIVSSNEIGDIIFFTIETVSGNIMISVSKDLYYKAQRESKIDNILK